MERSKRLLQFVFGLRLVGLCTRKGVEGQHRGAVILGYSTDKYDFSRTEAAVVTLKGEGGGGGLMVTMTWSDGGCSASEWF